MDKVRLRDIRQMLSEAPPYPVNSTAMIFILDAVLEAGRPEPPPWAYRLAFLVGLGSIVGIGGGLATAALAVGIYTWRTLVG